MSDWQHVFRTLRGLQPGPDFEDRVFAKIKKKKKQKKVGYGVTAAVGALLLLSMLQVFRPAVRPAPALDKEEIPLHEDLYFSTSDNRTRYTLEPVSFRKKRSGDPATINEI